MCHKCAADVLADPSIVIAAGICHQLFLLKDIAGAGILIR